MATKLIIHLVEDDDGARDSLSFLLQAAEYAVRAFSSAQEYLALPESEQPSCIITDFRMPGTGGLELIGHLRQRGRPTPVVIVTGDGGEQLAETARQTGAYEVIRKPFDDERLLAAVAAAIASSTLAPEDSTLEPDQAPRPADA